MKSIKIFIGLFKIMFLLFVYNSQVLAFSPLDNNCKVSFQKNIFLLDRKLLGKDRFNNDKNFYSWNGKCKNGFAYGKGDLKVNAVNKSLFFNINGTIISGYFRGQTYIEFSNSLENFIKSPYKVSLLVYKNNIFKSKNYFYRYVKRYDLTYANELKKQQQQQKQKQKGEQKGKNSFLSLIGFILPFLFIFWLFTPSKPTYNEDDYDHSTSFSSSELRDYNIEQTVGKIKREMKRR